MLRPCRQHGLWIGGCHALIVVWALSGCQSTADVGTGNSPAEPSVAAGPTLPVASRIWDLTSHLSPQQLATNAQIYGALEPDPYDVESEYDARVRRWVDDGSATALEALHEFGYDASYGRAGQAAAGRGYVTLAQWALTNGDYETAARYSLNIYLSSTPHRVRLETIRIFCASGPPDRIRRQIELIEIGRQDARFQPIVTELRQSLERRVKQHQQRRE